MYRIRFQATVIVIPRDYTFYLFLANTTMCLVDVQVWPGSEVSVVAVTINNSDTGC